VYVLNTNNWLGTVIGWGAAATTTIGERISDDSSWSEGKDSITIIFNQYTDSILSSDSVYVDNLHNCYID
jgi:hypothetical protein